jgi:hypothetical protein
MHDFLDLLGVVNQQLATRRILRLESFLMPALCRSLELPYLCSGKLPTTWKEEEGFLLSK